MRGAVKGMGDKERVGGGGGGRRGDRERERVNEKRYERGRKGREKNKWIREGITRKEGQGVRE